MQGIRRQGRSYALQLLYQVDQTHDREPGSLGRFWMAVDASQKPRDFAMLLVNAALDHQEQIDEVLTARLEKWKLSRLSVVVRNVLRLAVAEMVILRLNPDPIVINEAVELTRSFMDEESVAFVNSVLEKCRGAAGPKPAKAARPKAKKPKAAKPKRRD